MSLTVRLAAPEEFPQVGEITAAAYLHDGHVPTDDVYVDVLRDAAARAASADLLVVADGARILGTVTWCSDGSAYREVAAAAEGEFRMLAVTPQARGRGAARALVQACLDRSRQAGHTRVVLSTKPGMTRAHVLYESFGFVREPVRDWSPAPGVALVAYALELS